MDVREARLNEPHVRPLMDLVRSLRARGNDVPNVDPNDGGIYARLLVLMETPGPRAVGSGFVSRDNPDPSARNIGKVLDDASIGRSDVVLWNVVPHCVSCIDFNRNVTSKQIREAARATQAFIELLPRLAVVVFCGLSAQRALRLLYLPAHARALSTFHTGAQSYNHVRCRAHIHDTFKEAHAICSDQREKVGAGGG